MLAIPAAAQSPVLHLTGPAGVQDSHGFVDFYLDPDWTRTVRDMHGADRDLFRRHPPRDPDFGYTSEKVWLRIKLDNHTADTHQWRAHLHENFKQVFEAYLVRADGQAETLLQLTRDSRFSARPVAYPEMIAPFRLDPAEQATLYLSYWSEGSSYLSISLETLESFSELASLKTAKTFMFYGMMLLLICAALVSLVVLRNRIFLAYAGYAGAALLYVMHSDGVAFQYLWPLWPGFNNLASVVTGTGIIVFGAIYARIFLKTATYHPIIDKVLIAVIAVTLGLNGVLVAVNPQLLKKMLVFMSLVAIAIFTLAGAIAARHRFREVRFYLLAWVGAVLSATLLNLRHIFGLEISQSALHDSMRIVMVFDAVMMGLAITDGYTQLRQSRQKALQTSLSETQLNLLLTRRLSKLERQYELAVDLARARDESLQNTVHDLRQPLRALRLSVENQLAGHNGDPPADGMIESTFEYLESLISDQLSSNALLEAEDSKAQGRLDVPTILRNIHEMFLPDAGAKGLAFRFRPAALDADVPPLVLMRIVSNLVANAIKYTDQGGVLLGMRRRGDQLLIEIHDSGCGLSRAEFDRAKSRHVRLEPEDQDVQGHGLGLSIALSLARSCNMRIRLSGMRGSGTGLVLEIPLGPVGVDQTLPG